MGSKRNLHQDYKEPELSLFGGDDGFSIRRFLAREPSLSQSISDSFYHESRGIPFKWETEPGTPIEYPQQDGSLIGTQPLSPSPLMQSLKLRDEIQGLTLKSSKVKSFRKMVKKSIAFNRDKESLRFGEVTEPAKADSSVSSSSCSSFAIRWKDPSRKSMFASGYCRRKGNISSILLQGEENKGIIITRDEMEPDTPNHPSRNDAIWHHPPAERSSSLPPPRLHREGGENHRYSEWTKKALFWMKGSRGRRKTKTN